MDAKAIRVGGQYSTTHGTAEVVKVLGPDLFEVQRVGRTEATRRLRSVEFEKELKAPPADSEDRKGWKGDEEE